MNETDFRLLTPDLRAFDGGDAAGGEAAAGQAVTAAETGSGTAPVLPAQDGAQRPAQETAPGAPAPQTDDAAQKRRAFRALISGEYRDVYAEETQKLINRRFKETDGLRRRLSALEPVAGLLAERYGVADGDFDGLARAVEQDNALWADAAREAGMSVEQYRRQRALERENARLLAEQREQRARESAALRASRWQAEADALSARHPEFSLDAMRADPLFALLLTHGVPMEQAWRAATVDQREAQAAASAEKAVTANIRARGARPAESGGGAAAPFTLRGDVTKLSDRDVLDVLERLSRREHVSFG